MCGRAHLTSSHDCWVTRSALPDGSEYRAIRSIAAANAVWPATSLGNFVARDPRPKLHAPEKYRHEVGEWSRL